MLYSVVQNLRQKYLNIIEHILYAFLRGELQYLRSFLHLTHAQKILAAVAFDLVQPQFQKCLELDQRNVYL